MVFWSIVLTVLAVLLGTAWWHDRRHRGHVGELTEIAIDKRRWSPSFVRNYRPPGGPSGFGGGPSS